MKSVPIFDSATHPTINGEWLRGVAVAHNSLQELSAEMVASNVQWAMAIGIAHVGDYEAARYAEFIRSSSSKLVPVAYCEFDKLKDASSVKGYVNNLASKGYAGIKIHPRFSKVPLTCGHLEDVIKASNDCGMFVCLCTHLMDPVHGPENSLPNLMELLCRVSNEKMILLHGATVRVLELMEMAKVFKNKLVDLSYTMMKYEGSSLDLDLQWLFKNCDRRICIGSDHPEWSLSQLRHRFENLAAGLDDTQVENIAYKNLMGFCGACVTR